MNTESTPGKLRYIRTNPQQVAKLLKEEGFRTEIWQNLVHASLSDRLVSKIEIVRALDFDDTVRVQESPWGVSVLCMEQE